MPRAKRTDDYRRKEVNLSAEVCDLLEKLAADMTADRGRPVTQGEVIEKALAKLARQHHIE